MPDITLTDEIRTRADKLKERITRLESSLETYRRQLGALKTTMELLEPQQVTRKRAKSIDLYVTPDEIHSMTIEDALVHIAKRSNGIVASASARPLLIEAGLLRGTHAANALWTVLTSSDLFKKEGRGKYRYVAPGENAFDEDDPF